MFERLRTLFRRKQGYEIKEEPQLPPLPNSIKARILNILNNEHIVGEQANEVLASWPEIRFKSHDLAKLIAGVEAIERDGIEGAFGRHYHESGENFVSPLKEVLEFECSAVVLGMMMGYIPEIRGKYFRLRARGVIYMMRPDMELARDPRTFDAEAA